MFLCHGGDVALLTAVIAPYVKCDSDVILYVNRDTRAWYCLHWDVPARISNRSGPRDF